MKLPAAFPPGSKVPDKQEDFFSTGVPSGPTLAMALISFKCKLTIAHLQSNRKVVRAEVSAVLQKSLLKFK